MKKFLTVSFLFSVVILTGQIDQELANAFQNILDTELNDANLKGISAAVILPDNEIWTGVSGVAATDPLTTDHLFFAASNTKTFMAALMLQFEEQGLLTLDDPISDYIDDFENVNPDVTIKQLLNHSSGIYNYTNHPIVFDDLLGNPTTIFSPDYILENYVEAPDFSPETDWSYSNTNFTILGMIAETVTQSELHQILRERFFDPLELTSTTLGAFEPMNGELGGLWLDADGDGDLEDFSVFPTNGLLSGAWSAGGIVSRPFDLIRWVKSLHSGEILTESSMEKMLEITPFSQDEFTYYGLGMQNVSLLDCEFYGHTGGLIHTSVMYYSPVESIGAVVMINHADYNFLAFALLIEAIKENVLLGLKDVLASDKKIKVSPNPFYNQTSLKYSLAEKSTVRIELYNTLGQSVATFIKEEQLPGDYEFEWMATSLENGMYFYKAEMEGQLYSGEIIKQ